MFLNIFEILDIILMIFVLGFLFMSSFKPMKKVGDALDKYMGKSSGFDWQTFWFAALVTAPAIVFHEFGHKLTALAFGITSTFHAACSTSGLLTGNFLDFYCGLTILSIILKLLNFGFIFFIPAFVQISGNPTVLQSTVIAFAGPFVNLLLFVISYIVLNTNKEMSVNATRFWTLTKNINLFLFVFNILPIPGFDGFTVFSGLWHLFGL